MPTRYLVIVDERNEVPDGVGDGSVSCQSDILLWLDVISNWNGGLSYLLLDDLLGGSQRIVVDHDETVAEAPGDILILQRVQKRLEMTWPFVRADADGDMRRVIDHAEDRGKGI